MSFLCLFLLALPVFFKYVVVYRGAYLEGGIMLSLFISGILCQSVLYLALVSMVSMGMLNFGCYEWLRHNVRMPSKWLRTWHSHQPSNGNVRSRYIHDFICCIFAAWATGTRWVRSSWNDPCLHKLRTKWKTSPSVNRSVGFFESTYTFWWLVSVNKQ